MVLAWLGLRRSYQQAARVGKDGFLSCLCHWGLNWCLSFMVLCHVFAHWAFSAVLTVLPCFEFSSQCFSEFMCFVFLCHVVTFDDFCHFVSMFFVCDVAIVCLLFSFCNYVTILSFCQVNGEDMNTPMTKAKPEMTNKRPTKMTLKMTIKSKNIPNKTPNKWQEMTPATQIPNKRQQNGKTVLQWTILNFPVFAGLIFFIKLRHFALSMSWHMTLIYLV